MAQDKRWMHRTTHARLTISICALLSGIILAVFWPILHSDFLNYDDPTYVTVNSHVLGGLTWPNMRWAVTSGYASNWHPLTWLSHMLDVQLFGLKPAMHHLVNLLFHTANSLLLFLLLKGMTGALWRSAVVAALFALHPLHVESVAWVAERKDVLSTLFFLLTIWAYVRYADSRNQNSSRSKRDNIQNYVLSLLFFALGLMSKPMLVTTPFVLLLLDYWPLGRFTLKAESLKFKTLFPFLAEKLPFLALAIISSGITLFVQTPAMVDPNALPLSARLQNAALACVAYLGDTFWPTRLAVFYPYPTDFSEVDTIAAIALLLGITLAAVFLARRWPFVLVGWFWFLGMLAPVLGIVQVGSQARADRYTYLPLIGIFILATWLAASFGMARKQFQWLLASGATAFLLALALTAHRQVIHWHNSDTLFTHAAQVTRDNYTAWSCLAIEDLRRKDTAGALTNLATALKYAEPHGAASGIKYYFGIALQMQGKGLEALPYLEESRVVPEQRAERSYRLALSLIEASRLAEAETALKQALEEKPDNPDFQLGLAALLQRQGQTNRAEQTFLKVLAGHPELPSAQRSFADFLVPLNRPAEAEVHFAAARRLLPSDVRLCRAYAGVLAQQGKNREAIQQLEEAVKLDPTNAAVRLELAELFGQAGQNREAVLHYTQALESDPKLIGALNDLAWTLATDPDEHIRNGPRAVELAERACQLTEWKAAVLMGTLAAAYAEAGRFADAVAMAEKALDSARAGKQEEIARRNEELLDLYRAGKAYHDNR